VASAPGGGSGGGSGPEAALRHPRRHPRRIVLKRDILFFEGLAILIKNACVGVTDLL
jgi:hypothetical protein